MRIHGILRLGSISRIVAVACFVPLLACSKKDEGYVDPGASAGTTTESPSTAALRVTQVETGKGLNADKTLKDNTDDFGVRDTVYVRVTTDGMSSGSTLSAKWTFQDGQTVEEKSQQISPTGGVTNHEFHIQKATAWPKGDYKVEIMLDGTSAGTKDFTIK